MTARRDYNLKRELESHQGTSTKRKLKQLSLILMREMLDKILHHGVSLVDYVNFKFLFNAIFIERIPSSNLAAISSKKYTFGILQRFMPYRPLNDLLSEKELDRCKT